ncbi:MAG TPA: hypothetical protein VGS57_21735 [Thermoanaerobaculia bacterium]|jgi:hypothetical protein|nr:hypothetical protein [Thermoanaerobaculia bacterium]
MVSRLPPPPAWVDADPEALRRALAEAKAASKLPEPGTLDYLADWIRWLQHALFGALERVAPWAGLPIVERVAIYAALGAALLAAFLVAVIAARRWRKRRALHEPAASTLPLPAAPTLPAGDAGWWQGELQRRLAEGRLRPALEAAWWWTARRLDPPGLDPSWTSGDLLRSAGASPNRIGAGALRAPLRRLDRQLWGGAELARDEVESVVAELGGALP